MHYINMASLTQSRTVTMWLRDHCSYCHTDCSKHAMLLLDACFKHLSQHQTNACFSVKLLLAVLLLHSLPHLQAGAAVGLAAAAFLLRGNSEAKPLHFIGAGSAGAAAGVLLHLLTRPAEQRGNNKMLHELVY